MVANGEIVDGGDRPTWPSPDDPEFVDANEQTRRLLEATQPEALAESLTKTFQNAFEAINSLKMFAGSYDERALDNAIAQLPPEQAEVFKRQLEFVRTFGKEQHATRETEGNLSKSLFDLSMQGIKMRNEPEQA